MSDIIDFIPIALTPEAHAAWCAANDYVYLGSTSGQGWVSTQLALQTNEELEIIGADRGTDC